MTVNEMVQSLKECDPEALVVVDPDGGEGGIDCVHDRGATVRVVAAGRDKAVELGVRLYEDGEPCETGVVLFPDGTNAPFLRAALEVALDQLDPISEDGRGVLWVDDQRREGRFGLLTAGRPYLCFVPDDSADRLFILASRPQTPLHWGALAIEVV